MHRLPSDRGQAVTSSTTPLRSCPQSPAGSSERTERGATAHRYPSYTPTPGGRGCRPGERPGPSSSCRHQGSRLTRTTRQTQRPKLLQWPRRTPTCPQKLVRHSGPLFRFAPPPYRSTGPTSPRAVRQEPHRTRIRPPQAPTPKPTAKTLRSSCDTPLAPKRHHARKSLATDGSARK
jgi:hypothetical protein